MSPKLKPLLLPQLVAERQNRESDTNSVELESSPSYYLRRSSSASDLSLPPTPTFSHSPRTRYSSSNSSLDLSMHQAVADGGPSSPTFTSTTKSSKRSLPDLQEEPQELDEEFDDVLDEYGYDSGDADHQHEEDDALAQSAFELATSQDIEYDLTDGFFSDNEAVSVSRVNNDIASTLSSKFPTLSRKWRQRKASNASPTFDAQRELSRSRAGSRATSSRSSSFTGSLKQEESDRFIRMPPTPTTSIYSDNGTVVPIDIKKANETPSDTRAEWEEKLATTPLLPPVMMDMNSKPKHFQSPLQSPSVADVSDTASSGAIHGKPSPPLSTKPSISSFHRLNGNRPGYLVPSCDIPPIHIADINDEWANKLGHANFTIQPEPYLPSSFDLQACRQLRQDWMLARCNYTKHLVRTGEHYGATSKTYRLTEQKWAQVDAEWKKNNDTMIAHIIADGGDAFNTLNCSSIAAPGHKMTKIPSLNDLRSRGKFPQLGDEDIVGPMVQATSQLQRTPHKKTRILKFFDKFPATLGRSLTS